MLTNRQSEIGSALCVGLDPDPINMPKKYWVGNKPNWRGVTSWMKDVMDESWQNASLVDDLVASSLTKKLAIQAIAQAGGKVTDLLVFLDRSIDAEEELGKLGITLHAVWNFSELMEWALGKAYLTRAQFEAIMEYPAKLEAYKKSVGYN